MLLLYPRMLTITQKKVLHLHSTMLLLYLLWLLHRDPGIRIYIPLCFYFIGADDGHKCASVIFTFHYASTLSVAPLSKKKCTSIYIPLCFYFIQQMIIKPEGLQNIYIPLCFYFIHTCRSDDP